MDVIEFPPAIQAWLVERVQRVFTGSDRPRPAELPTALPEGEVHLVASGGPFGWLLDARIDRVGERVALEVLENDRMGGENYFRVWDDGTVEPLEPAVQTGMIFRPDATAEQRAAVEEAYYANNRAAYELLHERGFLRGE